MWVETLFNTRHRNEIKGHKHIKDVVGYAHFHDRRVKSLQELNSSAKLVNRAVELLRCFPLT